MSFGAPPLQMIAGGTITPASIVKISSAAPNTVLLAASNATSPNIGISQQGTRRAPGTGDDDGNAAIAGDNLMIFGPGSVAMVQLAGTSTQGDVVTSDASGHAQTTTTTGDYCVGFLLESGVAGDLVQILVQPFVY